jgi:flavin-dependent dehydrogenase
MRGAIQQKPAGLRDRAWDLIVVGAGPAGSALATALADSHRVLLIDKEAFPRDKVCGDMIATYALDCLERLGVGEQVLRLAHAPKSTRLSRKDWAGLFLIGDPYRTIGVKERAPGSRQAMTLRRSVLDRLLAARAVARGATFIRGRVVSVERSPDGLCAVGLDGSRQPLRARIVALATGADVALLERLGMVTRRAANGFALSCRVRSSAGADAAYFCWDACDGGYSWIFPLGGRLFNMGTVRLAAPKPGRERGLRKTFDAFCSEFEPAAELLERGKIVSPIRAAPLRTGLSGSVPVAPQGAVIGIGECIGTTLPDLGEGIGGALRCAELAAPLVRSALETGDLSRLESYPALLKRCRGPAALPEPRP